LFTGLVLGCGFLTKGPLTGGARTLTVTADFDWNEDLLLGESISVSGVCLTVETAAGRTFTALASPETLQKSTLNWAQKVNLERALKLTDRLGGHLVSGHVDGCGRVKKIVTQGPTREIRLTMPLDLAPQVVPKGSITVDGVSLTVNKVFGNEFTVQTIPATLGRTTLKDLSVGVEVNLETDILAKYVQKLSSKTASPLSFDELASQGF
jgi:riboflavin synthase